MLISSHSILTSLFYAIVSSLTSPLPLSPSLPLPLSPSPPLPLSPSPLSLFFFNTNQIQFQLPNQQEYRNRIRIFVKFICQTTKNKSLQQTIHFSSCFLRVEGGRGERRGREGGKGRLRERVPIVRWVTEEGMSWNE